MRSQARHRLPPGNSSRLLRFPPHLDSVYARLLFVAAAVAAADCLPLAPQIREFLERLLPAVEQLLPAASPSAHASSDAGREEGMREKRGREEGCKRKKIVIEISSDSD
jgi:hypothetical protein